jgi:hypothetical protein
LRLVPFVLVPTLPPGDLGGRVVGQVLRLGEGDGPPRQAGPQRREDRGDESPGKGDHAQDDEGRAHCARSTVRLRSAVPAQTGDENGQRDAGLDRVAHPLLLAVHGSLQQVVQVLRHRGELRRRLGELAAVEVAVGEDPAQPFTGGGEQDERDRVRRDIHADSQTTATSPWKGK